MSEIYQAFLFLLVCGALLTIAGGVAVYKLAKWLDDDGGQNERE